MKIYISGKISGLDPEETEKKFRDAEEQIKQEYKCQVVNPYSLCQSVFRNKPEAKWIDKMAVCISALAECQAIFLLSDWYDSNGAEIEFAIANTGGLLKMHEQKV